VIHAEDSVGKFNWLILIAILSPWLVIATSMVLLWGTAFDSTSLCLYLLMHFITGFGITVGYHRLFTHSSFEAKPWLKFSLAVAGSMAVEGLITEWVADHRKHHKHSDQEGDPHSPIHGRQGVWQRFLGLLHAHVFWMFTVKEVRDTSTVADLKADPIVQWVDARFKWWVLLGILIPTLLGGLITMSWKGAVLGFVWGGAVRIVMVHNITWSINSICHWWGARPFVTSDNSRNNWFLSLLSLGESWHHNHHAFQRSARHGLRWWQIDLSWWFIKVMYYLGAVTKISTPSEEKMKAKLRHQDQSDRERAA
jgi:stearoyl-CoA desaturase (delta-9 desaturase)